MLKKNYKFLLFLSNLKDLENQRLVSPQCKRTEKKCGTGSQDFHDFVRSCLFSHISPSVSFLGTLAHAVYVTAMR